MLFILFLILKIILYIFLFVLLLLLAILAIPFEAEGTIRKPEETNFRGGIWGGLLGKISAHWLGRTLNVRIHLTRKGQQIEVYLGSYLIYSKFSPKKVLTPEKEEEKRRRKEEKKVAKPKKSIFERISSLSEGIEWLDYLPDILNVLGRLFRSLKLRLICRGGFGTGDPASTGMLYGLFQALQGGFSGVHLYLTPNFLRATLYGEVELSLRLWLGQTAGILIGFLVTSKGRKLIKRLWEERKKRKRAKDKVAEENVLEIGNEF